MLRSLNQERRRLSSVCYKSNYSKLSSNIRLVNFQLWIPMSISGFPIKVSRDRLSKMEEKILNSAAITSLLLTVIISNWEGVLRWS